MTRTITATAAVSLGHAIARDWAGRHYSDSDVAHGAAVAARGKVVIAAPARVTFGKKKA